MAHRSEVHKQALKMYREGSTGREIGLVLDISEGTVNTWARNAGISRGPGASNGTAISPERRAAALADLKASGEPLTRVARRHGVGATALTRWRDESEVAYEGGWVRDGLVWRPAQKVA